MSGHVMRLNEDGTFHAMLPDGSRDYDAEIRFAESLARMAQRAGSEQRQLKLSPRQIMADPRGISRIALDVIACEMTTAEAEYRVFTIASAAGVEADDAINMLHKLITRYEADGPRVARAVRLAVRPMMDARKPPDAIKRRAAEINKLGILTPEEIAQVLRSEYVEWKTSLTTTSTPPTTTGKPPT